MLTAYRCWCCHQRLWDFALVIRIKEAYNTVEENEISAMDEKGINGKQLTILADCHPFDGRPNNRINPI